MNKKPAILGGTAAFPEKVSFVRPWTPSLAELGPDLEQSLNTGMLTNATFVRRFEERAAKLLGVPEVIGVASCTSGLILALRCLGVRGHVALPSFTFCATGHAAHWNQLQFVLADSESKTMCVDPKDVERRLTPDVAAVMATHIYGCPCDLDQLEAICKARNLPLIYDAAHGFGATYKGRPVATSGTVSVFSLTPTKVVVAGEGGLIATSDAALARELRAARNYGDSGDYNCRFVGINARMGEWNAILGYHTMLMLDEQLAKRHAVAAEYRKHLSGIPGISWQNIPEHSKTSYKDFTILVDSAHFGAHRNVVAMALEQEGVAVKKYFYPPLHRMKCYEHVTWSSLPVAERLSEQALSLPIYPALPLETVQRICACIASLHEHRGPLHDKFATH